MKRTIVFIGISILAGCQTVSQSQTPSMYSIQQTLKEYVAERCVVKNDRTKDTKGAYIANLQFAADGSKWVKARASDTMNRVEGLVFYNFDSGSGTCTGRGDKPSGVPRSWREMTEYDADVILGRVFNSSTQNKMTDTRVALSEFLEPNYNNDLDALKKYFSSCMTDTTASLSKIYDSNADFGAGILFAMLIAQDDVSRLDSFDVPMKLTKEITSIPKGRSKYQLLEMFSSCSDFNPNQIKNSGLRSILTKALLEHEKFLSNIEKERHSLIELFNQKKRNDARLASQMMSSEELILSVISTAEGESFDFGDNMMGDMKELESLMKKIFRDYNIAPK